jgi:hypothetical protein
MAVSKRVRNLQAALNRTQPNRQQDWDAITYPFAVVNKKDGKSHGVYSTFEEAQGCVSFDKLTAYEIWERTEEIVEEEDGPADAEGE